MKDEIKPTTSNVLKKRYIPTADFYSRVIDSMEDYSILTLDNDLIINSWSSGSVTIFGYEADEIIGQSFDIIFTDEDRKNNIPQAEIDKTLIDGRAVDNRWHLCKDGSTFYAYGLVFPLIGMEGEMLGFVKILRDLTERKKSENAITKYIKELEELISHKDSILAILSHDLRNPLGAIIGSADYLASHFHKMEPDKIKHMLDLLLESSKNELNMLDYLVEWARIKYASDAFSPVQINLAGYVEKIFTSLKESATLNTINLHHEIEENTSVFADSKMLISILQNIVTNALRHTLPGGKITVTSKCTEDKIIIQIKDTGIGMSKEIQEKLFIPQLTSLSKAREEHKGAGIGLLLVKSFLEKNSGEIWVESIEGEGSSFYFTLPIKKPIDKTDHIEKINEIDETCE